MIYFLIYISAPLIEGIYDQSGLSEVIRVVMLSIFFNAITIVPLVILKKKTQILNDLHAVTSIIFIRISSNTLQISGFGVWEHHITNDLNSAFLSFFYFNKIWTQNLHTHFGAKDVKISQFSSEYIH